MGTTNFSLRPGGKKCLTLIDYTNLPFKNGLTCLESCSQRWHFRSIPSPEQP